MRRQQQTIEQLRLALAQAERDMRDATEKLDAADVENRTLRDAAVAGPSGFGPRAEKLLRLAESEAADIRSRAVGEASELMERSRAEAELHRHAVENALIARASEWEEWVARRTAECEERVGTADQRLAGARAEADRITAAAAQASERMRRKVAQEVDLARRRLNTEVDQVREQTQLEAGRLDAVRAATWLELERLAERITVELASPATARR